MSRIRPKPAFLALIKAYRPAIIVDVGSCDGAEARTFSQIVPKAHVIAFEANPRNAAAMVSDDSLSGIDIQPIAISDAPGPVLFHVVDVPPDKPWARGTSSLLPRTAEQANGLNAAEITVEAVRLDGALAGTSGRIAAWIDVEGVADRVVRSLTGIQSRIVAIHIETEHTRIWEGQADGEEVLRQIEKFGFRRVTQGEEGPNQSNTVFIRDALPDRLLWAGLWLVFLARQAGRGVAHRWAPRRAPVHPVRH
jgi:FkbM family methyltransferase